MHNSLDKCLICKETFCLVYAPVFCDAQALRINLVWQVSNSTYNFIHKLKHSWDWIFKPPLNKCSLSLIEHFGLESDAYIFKDV